MVKIRSAVLASAMLVVAPAQADADRQPAVRGRADLLDAKQLAVRPIQLGGGAVAKSVARDNRATEYGLMAIFHKALNNDAKYKATKADFEANVEAVPQAEAGYLPTAAFDYQRSSYRQNIMRASNLAFPTGVSAYPNESWTLTITQPLLKLPAAVKMNQAELSVEQAQMNLLAAEQELILRVAGSYLSLLAAQDVLDMVNAEREALQKQHEATATRLKTGLTTITEMYDVESRYSLAQAKAVQAENKVDDAKQGLKEIIGENVRNVHGFKGDFDAVAPQPAQIDPWVEAALEQNLTLQARNLATQIATLEVRRQRATYLPTVSLVGTLGAQDAGGSIYGLGQKANNAELGVRVNFPLYDGGMTASLVREAVARQAKAAEEQEQERRNAERQTRSAFLGVQASTRTLSALRKAVIAQDSALQAKLEGYRSGLYSVIAVLDAYRLYFAARRDYLQERYDYLVNRLKLKISVGTLSRNDLEDLSALIDR